MFKQFMEAFGIVFVIVATYFICKGIIDVVLTNVP